MFNVTGGYVGILNIWESKLGIPISLRSVFKMLYQRRDGERFSRLTIDDRATELGRPEGCGWLFQQPKKKEAEFGQFRGHVSTSKFKVYDFQALA